MKSSIKDIACIVELLGVKIHRSENKHIRNNMADSNENVEIGGEKEC